MMTPEREKEIRNAYSKMVERGGFRHRTFQIPVSHGLPATPWARDGLPVTNMTIETLTFQYEEPRSGDHLWRVVCEGVTVDCGKFPPMHAELKARQYA